MLERALKIDEKVYGPDHPNVAIRCQQPRLGPAGSGRAPGSQEVLREGSENRREGLRAGSSQCGHQMSTTSARSCRTWASCRKPGNAIERALKIDEKVYGPDHPNVASDVNNLGTVLQDLGELQEARKYFERALRICRQKLGEDHPTTKIIKRNLKLLDS